MPMGQTPWSDSYIAVHTRLRRHRGKASCHKCVDCGELAAHWSWDRTDEETSLQGSVMCGERGMVSVRYSADLSRYQPRCISCHVKMDQKLKAAFEKWS